MHVTNLLIFIFSQLYLVCYILTWSVFYDLLLVSFANVFVMQSVQVLVGVLQIQCLIRRKDCVGHFPTVGSWLLYAFHGDEQ